MCERVRDHRWVHSQFSRDVTDDVISRDVNIFFVKLHLLDPTAVLPAFNNLTRGTRRSFRHRCSAQQVCVYLQPFSRYR